jgi:hypothetical protein
MGILMSSQVQAQVQNQSQKDAINKLQKRLEMIRDLASSVSNPAVVRAELSTIMADPATYSAAILNVHLHQTLNEIVAIMNKKALDREEEIVRQRQQQVRTPTTAYSQ